MIRRPPRSTLSSSSAASDVYKRQVMVLRIGRLHQITAEVVIESWKAAGIRMAPRIALHHGEALGCKCGSDRVHPDFRIHQNMRGIGQYFRCLLYTSPSP